MKYWRTKAAQPVTSGVAMLVPLSYAYAGFVARTPGKLAAGAVEDFAEMISVPGATTSGLMRRSSHGPRLLKAAIASGSPEINSPAMGLVGKSEGQPSPQLTPFNAPLVRSLRLEPTVKAFLQEAGELMDSQSTNPGTAFLRFAPEPAFPAAMTMSMSGRRRTNSSTSSLLIA